ncbi:DUF1214 domain-containing protein [Candidatus Poriferisocius sp.]|uniref:DUF1214 domain-containing protein n=1 Tax=Candidatus Poriferisocius sp. TaxID=3101276 RepID=UPI003B58D57F
MSQIDWAGTWNQLCDALRDAGHKVLEAAPDDDFDRAEGLRYVTRVAANFLRANLEEADPARAVLNQSGVKIGLDNPDYVYGGARLSPRFDYRLRGRLNDAHSIRMGAFSGGLGTPGGLVRDSYLTTDDIEMDEDGGFEVAISAEPRPGAWLAMSEGTNSLTIRQTLLDRPRQTPAALTLERTDGGSPPQPVDPERLAGALGRAGFTVAAVVDQFLGWTAAFAAHPHRIRPIDPELLAFAQGDPDTSYNYGYFDLAADEAWIIEFEPPECEYWNIQLGNHWLESLDFEHYRTSINHHTAVVEDDGTIRVVVAHRDPGHPNWLDTAGHTRGGLALRWVGAETDPAVSCRLEVIP